MVSAGQSRLQQEVFALLDTGAAPQPSAHTGVLKTRVNVFCSSVRLRHRAEQPHFADVSGAVPGGPQSARSVPGPAR